MTSSNQEVYKSLLTPLGFLRRSVAVYPGKTAVVYGDKRYTYRELGERVNRLASALRAKGLQEGDRVAFLCPNTPPLLEAHFGVNLAGGILVAINTSFSASEIEYILNRSGATFLFFDTELTETIGAVHANLETVKHTINIEDASGYGKLPGADYESFLAAGSPDPVPWVLEDEDESISICYTSGTTGRPKGVVYSHRGAYLNAINEALETNLRPDCVYLWTHPMFHANGWCFIWAVTAMGGTHVCLRKFDPNTAWPIIVEEGVTHFHGAPVLVDSLLDAAERPDKLARPLAITTAGTAPSPTLIEKVRAMGAELIHVYGSTEVYGPIAICAMQPDWHEKSPEELGKLLSRQGVAYIMAEPVRVVDENMNDVPSDGETCGEIVLRGNNVMKGYYDDPEATEKAFRGGYFHTDDIGVMHPDGYFELRDRASDIITSDGKKISSIEIEHVLSRHPAVIGCAVIAVPHEELGESPKAFVTLKPGESITEADIIAFCRENMAEAECPTAVAFIDLPRTSTGKPQKFVLREQECKGGDKRSER